MDKRFTPYILKAYIDLMSRDADAEKTDSMLRNSVKFIVPGFVENTTHIRPANGFSCHICQSNISQIAAFAATHLIKLASILVHKKVAVNFCHKLVKS